MTDLHRDIDSALESSGDAIAKLIDATLKIRRYAPPVMVLSDLEVLGELLGDALRSTVYAGHLMRKADALEELRRLRQSDGIASPATPEEAERKRQLDMVRRTRGSNGESKPAA